MLATAATPSFKTIAAASVTTSAAAIATTAATTTTAQQCIRLCAPAANTAAIYYGDSTVTAANGIELSAGVTVDVWVDYPSRIFAIAASGTQSLRILVL